jgi:hypothetical protein
MRTFRATILIISFVAINAASGAQVPRKSETMKVNGYTLSFSPTDSIQMTDIFGADGELRKKMTDTLQNDFEKTYLFEKYLSTKMKNIFFANDSILTLHLENGKELTFPKVDYSKDEGYNLEYYFPSINYYLLRVAWGEGGEWMLVNRKNGFKKRIIGYAYISPSLKRVLSVNDAMPGYGESGIELLTVSGDTLKSEFKVRKDLGTTGAKWISDDKAIIENEYMEDDKKFYFIMTIKK